jgi:aerobic-type carbon monoxide dehydrogenase small subunit (CoxS/CutS family)
MPDTVTLKIDGRTVTVPHKTTVAAAIIQAHGWRFRQSIGAEPRAALCGMGTCFECRVTINDQPHQRSCLRLCQPDLDVQTS